MTTDAEVTDPAAPPGAIDVDLPCRRCGYNVRGLTQAATCPECGTAVAITILGDTLEGAHPTWLRHVAAGARWVAVSNGLLVAFLLCSGCVRRASDRVEAIWSLGLASLLMARLLGVVRWTRADPAGLEPRSRAYLRWMARVCAVAPLLLVCYFFSPVARSAVPGSFRQMVVPAWLLAGPVGEAIQLVYGSALMRRGLDRELRARFQTFWGLETTILGIMTGIAVLATMFGGTPSFSEGCAMLAGAVVYGITVLTSIKVYFDCALELELSIARGELALQPIKPVTSSR